MPVPVPFGAVLQRSNWTFFTIPSDLLGWCNFCGSPESHLLKDFGVSVSLGLCASPRHQIRWRIHLLEPLVPSQSFGYWVNLRPCCKVVQVYHQILVTSLCQRQRPILSSSSNALHWCPLEILLHWGCPRFRGIFHSTSITLPAPIFYFLPEFQ